MKTKTTTLILFLAGILAMSVNPGHAQSLCDPDFWKSDQPEDIDQINEFDRICDNRYDTGGMPVFHVVALHASPELFLEFLNKSSIIIDTDIKDEHGRTALHRAVSIGRSKTVQILVDAGANPDIQDDGYRATALHLAALNGYSGVVQILVDAGADPDIQDEYGETALHWAARHGIWRSEVVQILVDAGADLNIKNNDGETALVIAVERGRSRSDIARILVGAGARKGGLIKQLKLYQLLLQ